MKTEWILWLLCAANLIIGICCLVKLSRIKESGTDEKLASLRRDITASVDQTVHSLGGVITQNQQAFNETLNRNLNEKLETVDKNLNGRMDALQQTVTRRLYEQEQRIDSLSQKNEQRLTQIRETVELRLQTLTDKNDQRLDQMRGIVEEKLEKTLNDRMTESFKQVSDRLEQVYKGLGEMQSLAAGVGDLKKVLTNVKQRGILGELQLGAILRDILSPEQYEENVETKKGSGKRVEFAIKLPADDGRYVYLPIDSKFPGDTYAALADAYEAGDKAQIDAAARVLTETIRKEAKDISDKYIDPPATTDFAILFLPFEGLYAEAVNRGMVEKLQHDYKINLAGPSTMAALLNSLQMGFKTLAIQKRSSEVWDTLSAVKVEFGKFADVLDKARNRIRQADDELDKLVSVRTKAINRKLRNVTVLPDAANSAAVLELEDGTWSDDTDA